MKRPTLLRRRRKTRLHLPRQSAASHYGLRWLPLLPAGTRLPDVVPRVHQPFFNGLIRQRSRTNLLENRAQGSVSMAVLPSVDPSVMMRGPLRGSKVNHLLSADEAWEKIRLLHEEEQQLFPVTITEGDEEDEDRVLLGAGSRVRSSSSASSDDGKVITPFAPFPGMPTPSDTSWRIFNADDSDDGSALGHPGLPVEPVVEEVSADLTGEAVQTVVVTNEPPPQQYAEPGDRWYTVEELTGARPLEVDPGCKEQYLADSTFESVFSLTKQAFRALPLWKQQQLKRSVNLF
mmetsp:Transcript_98031/g.224825  ORF Transcript_98031/g.224825 Transcript_98031/m.224825 type:complete len:290 (-) Transcript_98031:108-977(-)